ncbi:L-threonylcarbamoyladenylate synthase [Clostridium algidicarnis]|uniref:L-threonylcarbamoyladenylate synthase n=1 Tax=Clostridium algidicarnis TaxID=37659 RepID=UPI00049817A2|nr:L-threonylcarbamoyladenylate synthase [Clostridium algidicarnis]
MNTKVVKMNEDKMNMNAIEEAASTIKAGGLVVFPTETVYGLGANALDGKAVSKIFEAKGRPQDNPLIIHVADFNIKKYIKDLPMVATKLMEKFWPGPITFILNKSDIIPLTTSAGLNTIGIRMPSNKIARELILKSGVPIAAPSANISGRPSPTEVERCIEDLNEKVEYILGGEGSNIGLESTILDCTVEPPCILRPGAITLEMLKEVKEDIYIDPAVMKMPSKELKPKAPGMKYRHYAPKAPLKIIRGDLKKTIAKVNEIVQNCIDEGKTVGIIATEETKNLYNKGIVLSLGSRKDLDVVAKNLFECLRAIDDKNVDLILSESFEEIGIGSAIMNRLKKSAGFDILDV